MFTEHHGWFCVRLTFSVWIGRVSFVRKKIVSSMYRNVSPPTAYCSVSMRRVDAEYGQMSYSTAGVTRPKTLLFSIVDAPNGLRSPADSRRPRLRTASWLPVVEP